MQLIQCQLVYALSEVKINIIIETRAHLKFVNMNYLLRPVKSRTLKVPVFDIIYGNL